MSFGGASFGIATSGVAPFTSFTVCAALGSTKIASAITVIAPMRPTELMICLLSFARDVLPSQPQVVRIRAA